MHVVIRKPKLSGSAEEAARRARDHRGAAGVEGWGTKAMFDLRRIRRAAE